MPDCRSLVVSALLVLPALAGADEPAPPARPRTTAEVLAATTAADWRPVDPAHTLYLELTSGRAVVELAPAFAPRHVQNVETMVRERYFDGLAFLRSQENYVVQWGDPDGEDAEKARSLGTAAARLIAELDRPLEGVPFAPLGDADVYAPEVGFSQGFPVARDPSKGRAWLAHCYGMVGAGRGNEVDSGSGSELYVVIGHSPRHLDRNVTLLGRVLEGMEHLSTLPRGHGGLGFYETAAERQPLPRIRLAASLPEDERTPLEVLRTDTPRWVEYVASRRTRREEWFLDPVGKVELCNVAIPVRRPPPPAEPAPRS